MTQNKTSYANQKKEGKVCWSGPRPRDRTKVRQKKVRKKKKKRACVEGRVKEEGDRRGKQFWTYDRPQAAKYIESERPEFI